MLLGILPTVVKILAARLVLGAFEMMFAGVGYICAFDAVIVVGPVMSVASITNAPVATGNSTINPATGPVLVRELLPEVIAKLRERSGR